MTTSLDWAHVVMVNNSSLSRVATAMPTPGVENPLSHGQLCRIFLTSSLCYDLDRCHKRETMT